MTWLGNLLGAMLLRRDLLAGRRRRDPQAGRRPDLLRRRCQDARRADGARRQGILCNWLVCLALWMAPAPRRYRQMHPHLLVPVRLHRFRLRALGRQHDGVRHRAARQSSGTVTVGGAFYNLLWVSLGNIISGVVFVGSATALFSGTCQAAPRRRTRWRCRQNERRRHHRFYAGTAALSRGSRRRECPRPDRWWRPRPRGAPHRA